MIGLAAAMGIGRFALTPLLPLMQAHESVSLVQGGFLASANYIGYLLGALWCLARSTRPAIAAPFGLLAVALSTLAMALTSSVAVWLALRLVAGVASAFVLVSVSAWALAALPPHLQSKGSGLVFAGVGIGLLLAGLVAIGIGVSGLAPSAGWLLLGSAALVATLVVARAITDAAGSPLKRAGQDSNVLGPDAWRLTFCYGAFGFGYIIPATFLPAAARALVDDPAVFGWAWPAFGLASATSTIAFGAILKHVPPGRIWALAQAVMAFGVALPAFHLELSALIVSAVCVGGTFMTITMAAMQEAQRIGGQSSYRLMALLTSAFAAGQVLGPLTIAEAGVTASALRTPSLVAAALLFVTALILLPRPARALGGTTPPRAPGV